MSAKRLVFTLVLLLSGLVGGMVITGRMRTGEEAAAQAAATPAPVVAGPAAAATTLPDFSRIAERTVPAVANISSTQIIRRQNTPYYGDPFSLLFGVPEIQGSRRASTSGR